MKKLLYLCPIALILYLSLVIAFAHPGRTDGNGGHYNRDTGEYHYHHGYGPHSHDDGFCPIEPDNDRYYSEPDIQKENVTSNFKFESTNSQSSKSEKVHKQDFLLWFVKLSPAYIWGASDVIHLIITFAIIGFLIYIFSSERSISFTIAFIVFAMSAIIFSLSLIFSNPSKESFFEAWVAGVTFTIIIYPLLVGGTYTTLSDFNLL